MSAFICGNDTIQKCVMAIAVMNADQWRNHHPYVFNGLPSVTSEDLTNIGGVLFNMNVQAVCERYSDDDFELSTFQFKREPVIPTRKNMTAYYKALACLSYQCSEGNVPERPEYKALKKLLGDFAQYIVSNSPEYETAEWG